MLQCRGEHDLAPKSIGGDGRRHLRRQQLDDNPPLEPHVAREDHLRHAAARELSLYDVLVSEMCLKTAEEVGQRILRECDTDSCIRGPREATAQRLRRALRPSEALG
jgi:hypothetical protein